MVGSCWLHFRLKLCRTAGGGEVGWEMELAGSCHLHWRLRLYRRREQGCDGFMLASL